MSLSPLLSAPLEIQFHVIAVCVAAILSPVQFFMQKGTRRHRMSGFFWIAAMLLAALSSFFIHTIRFIGPFSPIHLLSVLTLVSVPMAWWSAKRGDIVTHRRIMQSLVVFAIIGAGAFTLFPGRIMNAVVFGP